MTVMKGRRREQGTVAVAALMASDVGRAEAATLPTGRVCRERLIGRRGGWLAFPYIFLAFSTAGSVEGAATLCAAHMPYLNPCLWCAIYPRPSLATGGCWRRSPVRRLSGWRAAIDLSLSML